MPTNPVLESLRAQVEQTVGVMESATALVNGFTARLQAAVDQALENGATEAELAPVQAEVDALKGASDALAAAVAANA